MPVTVPVALTVPSAALLLLHTPPAVALPSSVVAAIHTDVVPVIAGTAGLIVTLVTALQPLLMV
jgi:hypothetical protein